MVCKLACTCSFFTSIFIYLSDNIFTLIRISIPYPLQWGPPTFNADHAFGMMAAVMVSLIEVP
jgi:hypothetical protein